MSNTPQSSRPAFPIGDAKLYSEKQGLTKREYFAIECMKALITLNPESLKGNIGMPAESNLVSVALDYADELLKRIE